MNCRALPQPGAIAGTFPPDVDLRSGSDPADGHVTLRQYDGDLAHGIYEDLLIFPKEDFGISPEHGVIGLLPPGERPPRIDLYHKGPKGCVRRKYEVAYLGLPLRPEIRIDQPGAKKLATRARAVVVIGATPARHGMNAPPTCRLVQFIDRIDLAAHAAGSAGAAGDERRRGVWESGSTGLTTTC
jgi:hypothetical protein